MKPSFVLTPAACDDIDDILEYVLEQSGPSRALRVHQKLLEACSRIAERPNLLGHLRDDLGDESLRALVVFSYLIIYRPDTMPVEVVRVIHGVRDMSGLFKH